MSDLLDLAARCEAATGPDRELDAAIARSIGLEVQAVMVMASRPYEEVSTIHRDEGAAPVSRPVERFTASLDAAMTLVPEGRFVGALSQCDPSGEWYARIEAHDAVYEDATAPSGALALCAAALRVRDAA